MLTQRLLGVGSATGAGAGAGAATGGGGGGAGAAASGGCTQAHSEPDSTPDNSTKAVFPFIALLRWQGKSVSAGISVAAASEAVSTVVIWKYHNPAALIDIDAQAGHAR